MSENTDRIGILKISETVEQFINAISAKLHLEISGENFVYGNAALEKSAEVKNLPSEIIKSFYLWRNVILPFVKS